MLVTRDERGEDFLEHASRFMSLSFLVQIIYCKLLAAESQIQVIIGSVLLKLKRSSQKS